MKLKSLVLVAGIVVGASMLQSPAFAVTANDFKAGADLHGITANTLDLRGKDLSNINLSGATLTNVVLDNANLSHANLSGAKFITSEMKYIDFSFANLNNTTFTRPTLSGSRFQFITANNVKIVDCTCNFFVMRSSSFKGGNFNGTTFRKAQWNANTLDGVGMLQTNFIASKSLRDVFKNTVWSYANFTGSEFSKAQFSGLDMTGNDFGTASFPNSSFINITLKNVVASKANLRGVSSQQIKGSPKLPKTTKLVAGRFQMAPATPKLSRALRVKSKPVIEFYEVLQTGGPATKVMYRISSDRKSWSKWYSNKGTRIADDFNFRTAIRVPASGTKLGRRYYVQAYLVNALGKSATTTSVFTAK